MVINSKKRFCRGRDSNSRRHIAQSPKPMTGNGKLLSHQALNLARLTNCEIIPGPETRNRKLISPPPLQEWKFKIKMNNAYSFLASFFFVALFLAAAFFFAGPNSSDFFAALFLAFFSPRASSIMPISPTISLHALLTTRAGGIW